MSLAAGTKLGPYEILSPLGAGGMGEVYKARDTRLERTVAIKVLNSSLVASPEIKARFEREAKTISQLNHPNICTLYDVGHEAETDFLVMEFLEGESLAERLKRGPVALPDLVKMGCEIADALDRAHRAGIVHRDLKPGNVMLTKTGAKLLDFGLAKPAVMGASAASVSAPLLSAAMTMTSPSPQQSPLTQQGALVGTVQYMSPEQIQGMEADARSDIFAFGAVLYEMATGRRPFEGRSQIKIASAILEDNPPPVASFVGTVPPSLDRLIHACLAKEPGARFASAHDVGMQLRWIGEGARAGEASSLAPGATRNIGWIAATVLAVAVITLGFWLWRSSPTESPAPALAYVPAPAGTRLLAFGFGAGPVVVSPDASKLAFSAIARDGTIRLWVRQLASGSASALAGTENASAPFWSPDSHALAFFADGKLKTIDLASGNVEVLCDVPVGASNAGSWSAAGVIVFSKGRTKPLSRVAATGGNPTDFPPLRAGEAIADHPTFLPDGDHFLYSIAGIGTPPRIEMAALSSAEHRLILENAAHPEYDGGFLLFVRDSKVFAQAFNAAKGRLAGAAKPLMEASAYSAAGPVLAFQAGSSKSHLQWFDASGLATGAIGDVASYVSPKLSPDGKRVLAIIDTPDSRDLWVIPTDGGVSTRLTFGASGFWSVWSPDGKYIAYGRVAHGKVILVRKPSDGSGGEEVLATLDPEFITAAVVDWSPDGRYLSYDALSSKTGRFSIWILPLAGDRKPFRIAQGDSPQYDGNFSPDGRWLAYFSGDSGRPEVYVVPFPGPGGKYQISNGGGWLVRWAKNDQLYFMTTGNQLMHADLATNGTSLQIKSIRPMFATPLLDISAPLFDVTGDGKRIIAVIPADAEANSIGMLLNWRAELKK